MANSSSQEMVVLVTGGAGYIGSHTCQVLARRGYQPVVYDNLSRGHRELVKWGPLVVGDLADRKTLSAALAEHRPAAVLHFAAFAYVGESMKNPEMYYNNNFAGSLNLIQAMLAAKIHRLVFSSTCATYGVPDVDLIDENTDQKPVNPYGHSKKMVEQLLRDSVALGLNSVALRYFNAAGADPGLETGEWHVPETHLIPLALAAVDPAQALPIFGTDYPTPDGTCVRDYIHVVDLAEAHVLALEKLLASDTPMFSAYNLGMGHGHSVREVTETVAKTTGKAVHVRNSERRRGDPPRLVADASLVARELGWKPQLSDLPSIVKTAWAWQQKHAAKSEST
jgi:UDP-glucose-4-epimerase GalE